MDSQQNNEAEMKVNGLNGDIQQQHEPIVEQVIAEKSDFDPSVLPVENLADQINQSVESGDLLLASGDVSFVQPATPMKPCDEQLMADITTDNDPPNMLDRTLTSESTQNESQAQLNPFNLPESSQESVVGGGAAGEQPSEQQILNHASDSGYCFTNSISEFSTSFPSRNKLENNLCSTPVQEENGLLQQTTTSDTGVVDNTSIGFPQDQSQVSKQH